jgi:hypothetical protein
MQKPALVAAKNFLMLSSVAIQALTVAAKDRQGSAKDALPPCSGKTREYSVSTTLLNLTNKPSLSSFRATISAAPPIAATKLLILLSQV